MKTNVIPSLCALAVLFISGLPLPPARAQGTVFTYQGRLSDGSGPADGSYDLLFILYSAAVGGSQQGPILTNASTAVSNGLFTAVLDFGNVFDGSSRWLEIQVRTNGGGAFTPLNPRQALTPAPYAITAGNIPAGAIGGAYGNVVAFTNSGSTFVGAFGGDGGGLTNVNATAVGGVRSSNLWRLDGNAGTTAGPQFLGTTDNQPLEIKVGAQRALRLEPNAPSGAPNIIGGSWSNSVDPGIIGATIAGGGATNYAGLTPNRVGAIFGTVSGGRNNSVYADHGSVGGGHDNVIWGNAYDAAIAGGSGNYIWFNSTAAVIDGGQQNTILSSATGSVIGGGGANIIGVGSYNATVSGGAANLIEAPGANIGGGSYNTNGGFYSVISGGVENFIPTNAYEVTIGGGQQNQALYNSSTVAGGLYDIAASNYSTVGGGYFNAASNYAATVAGGAVNGANGFGSSVAGGEHNLAGARDATVGGGYTNIAGGYSATVPGGYGDQALGAYSFAAGLQAIARHDGAFVWADSQGGPFQSAALNQFVLRAGGGVGIGTTATPPGGLRVHTGGLAVTGASSPNYGTNAGVYIEYGTYGNVFAFDYGPFQPRSLVLNGPGGLVGVRRAPTANALEVEGEASKTFAGSWAANSDARIKQDVHTVADALDKLDRVRLVSFRYTPEYRQAHRSIEDRPYLNVIAQEFREVFPDAVKSSGEKLPDGSDEILQVDTYPLTIYSAAAIQELHQALKQKDAEIRDLHQRLEALERTVARLSRNAE
jgi:hypothetical protein